mmetsp:Transcript_45751/g.115158  ORF Transcript_45751/g.115158 Transcript_45751/m.115158 type:complete len:251 (+) Transcript_45751:894-1646(+)
MVPPIGRVSATTSSSSRAPATSASCQLIHKMIVFWKLASEHTSWASSMSPLTASAMVGGTQTRALRLRTHYSWQMPARTSSTSAGAPPGQGPRPSARRRSCSAPCRSSVPCGPHSQRGPRRRLPHRPSSASTHSAHAWLPPPSKRARTCSTTCRAARPTPTCWPLPPKPRFPSLSCTCAACPTPWHSTARIAALWMMWWRSWRSAWWPRRTRACAGGTWLPTWGWALPRAATRMCSCWAAASGACTSIRS